LTQVNVIICILALQSYQLVFVIYFYICDMKLPDELIKTEQEHYNQVCYRLCCFDSVLSSTTWGDTSPGAQMYRLLFYYCSTFCY